MTNLATTMQNFVRKFWKSTELLIVNFVVRLQSRCSECESKKSGH